jgi:hypothetical protein
MIKTYSLQPMLALGRILTACCVLTVELSPALCHSAEAADKAQQVAPETANAVLTNPNQGTPADLHGQFLPLDTEFLRASRIEPLILAEPPKGLGPLPPVNGVPNSGAVRIPSASAGHAVTAAREPDYRSPQFQANLRTLRKTGQSILEADRAKANRDAPTLTRAVSAQDLEKAALRKLDEKPLPEIASAKGDKAANCERNGRIEELEKQVAAMTDPQQRERTQLVLAGYQVGQGNWLAAQKIYQELIASSRNPAVVQAANQDLDIVNRKLTILAETNPTRREQLELDLAKVHAALGHEQAASRLYRRLAASAADPSVRNAADEMVNPGNHAPPPVSPKLKQLPASTPPKGGGQ